VINIIEYVISGLQILQVVVAIGGSAAILIIGAVFLYEIISCIIGSTQRLKDMWEISKTLVPVLTFFVAVTAAAWML